jgi:hypothetical protein
MGAENGEHLSALDVRMVPLTAVAKLLHPIVESTLDND